MVGHHQSPSVAKYRPDLPELQYISVNFCKSPQESGNCDVLYIARKESKLLPISPPVNRKHEAATVNGFALSQDIAVPIE